jgi:hypothetical protein
MAGTYYTTASTLDTPIMQENRSKFTQPQPTLHLAKMRQMTLQPILPTYKSEVHQQLSTLVAWEAHSVPGTLYLEHPPDLTESQTHLIATLCLLKPWQ